MMPANSKTMPISTVTCCKDHFHLKTWLFTSDADLLRHLNNLLISWSHKPIINEDALPTAEQFSKIATNRPGEVWDITFHQVTPPESERFQWAVPFQHEASV